MHAPRPHAPLPRRLGAGIAAAAVLTAGLACLGTAHAAELADFPQDLTFSPTDLVATADDVYAVGYVGVDTDEDYVFDEIDGYVEAVGAGVKVHLGNGSWPSAVAASPDGATLRVIGTQVDEEYPENGTGNYVWTIDTETMTVSSRVSEGFSSLYDIATGAGGTWLSSTDDGAAKVRRIGSATVNLGYNIAPTKLALLPNGESTDVVVAGTDYLEEGNQASLRIISGEEVGEKVVLGPDGSSDDSVIDVDVDEVNGLIYATSFRNVEDGPQEYGLNVIGGETDLYIPIDYPVFSVAVSPDGETVYLPGTGVSAYDADQLASYTEEEPAPAADLGGSGFIGLATLDPSGRLYATMDHDVLDPVSEEPTGEEVTRVHALEAPSAPTGLTALTSEWDSSTLSATWSAPSSSGGASDGSLSYRLTLQDDAGGEAITAESFMTDHEFTNLLAGHTYTLSVTSTNGAFTGAPATASWTAPSTLAKPGAVAVTGKASVASRLSVATTGSWPEGTALTYEWRNNAGTVLSRSATMVVSATQVARRIRVHVTGTLAGFTPATVVSPYSAQVAQGTLVAPTPKISGTAKVGRTLTATPGSWTSGTRLTYRWTSNGTTIRGATSRTFKPTRAQVGKRIRVVVTGTKSGYRTVAKTSGVTAAVKR
ncbi:hypothetical protein ASE01_06400 [Nocardioides sp. Root190]|uniref:fibronectin type III domain-containing protein n=1 Tax=Nocardioides sp. Root190 TaxID=1736488 RepID=UPI0006FC710F|nr:fibronectin type III domain-containing protein [Nocardioides sp. Root190]KRB77820.1 hypothetical protein ASE01_06400 [Nocardioides sp. Root190]